MIMNKEELLKDIERRKIEAMEKITGEGQWPRIWITKEEAKIYYGLPEESDKNKLNKD